MAISSNVWYIDVPKNEVRRFGKSVNYDSYHGMAFSIF